MPTGGGATCAALVVALLGSLVLAGCGGGGHVPPARNARWSGDYQTGDFSQWTETQANPGDATVGTHLTKAPPPPEFPRVAQFTISSSSAVVGHGRRAEVLGAPRPDDAVEGAEDYWRWYIYFPSSFHYPPALGPIVLTDWHNAGSGCAQPLMFGTDDGLSLYMRIRSGATPNLPAGACATPEDRRYVMIPRIRSDHWYQITLHVKWSREPGGGFVESWVDGCHRTRASDTDPLGRSYRFPTLMDERWGKTYVKQGQYSPAGWPVGEAPNTVYYTGTANYADFKDVWPSGPVCHPTGPEDKRLSAAAPGGQ